MRYQKLRSSYEITDNAGMVFVIGPEVDLTGADLRGLDLSDSDLTGAILQGADLTCADLSYSDFAAANFSPGDHAPVALDWAVMIGSNFEFADLTRVSMVEAEAAGRIMLVVAAVPCVITSRRPSLEARLYVDPSVTFVPFSKMAEPLTLSTQPANA